MIALKLTDDLQNVLEVSIQPNMEDETKNSVVIEVESENNEKNELRSNFYYVDDKEQLNELISKLISAKKQMVD